MKGITHAYEVSLPHITNILHLKLQKAILPGFYTFPLYGMNGELVSLLDAEGKPAGSIAINAIHIIPAKEVSESDVKLCGYETRESYVSDMRNSLFVTVIDFVPVIQDETACNCASNGTCQCKAG